MIKFLGYMFKLSLYMYQQINYSTCLKLEPSKQVMHQQISTTYITKIAIIRQQ